MIWKKSENLRVSVCLAKTQPMAKGLPQIQSGRHTFSFVRVWPAWPWTWPLVNSCRACHTHSPLSPCGDICTAKLRYCDIIQHILKIKFIVYYLIYVVKCVIKYIFPIYWCLMLSHRLWYYWNHVWSVLMVGWQVQNVNCHSHWINT